MKRDVKEILTSLKVFLSAIRTKFSGYFRTTIEAVGFGAVLFMAHGAEGLLL